MTPAQQSGAQSGDLSQQAPWRQVLGLGEKLIRLTRQVFTGEYSAPADPDLAIGNLVAQHNLIVETAARLLQGQAHFWLSDTIAANFTGRVARPVPLGSPLSELMRCALDTRQVCGGESANCISARFLLDRDEVQAGVEPALALAVPLISPEGQVLGVLQVERPEAPEFIRQDAELAEGIAAQATLALQAGLQMVNERWRLQQLSLVRKVSAQIASVRDLDELARRVTGLIQQTFNYYYVAIFTLEPGQDILHFRAGAGLRPVGGGGGGDAPATPGVQHTLVVHMGQGIIGHVAQTGQEVLANDVQHEAFYRHLDALPETRSEVSLPLQIEGRLLGVLDVQSDQPGYFGETDLLVLRALAGNISFAVEGARLYSALHKRATQLSAVYEVSNAITSILDTEKLLAEVVDLIQKRFGYPYVHLFTVHTGRRKVFYEAGSGSLSKMLSEQGFAYDLDDSTGLIPWVARSGDTILANDVSQEPRYRPSALSPNKTLSELTLPLVFGKEVLGVLDVQSDQLNAFSEEDRFLFEALADNVAVAMRNATLYRSEVWRRQVADSLREVAGLLSANLDLDQVLEAILTELERNLPLDVAAIWLREEDDENDENTPPVLHLAAMRGESVASLDIEIGLSPEDVLEFNPASEAGITQERASDWLGEVLHSDQPVVRTQHSPYDPLGAALGFPLDYSAIAAPLRVGQNNLGVLTLAHQTPGRYGGEARAMTAAFASYAAVAIENARLYEEAHEQAWVSTVLLQVAEATQSITNLSELLDTVIRITPTLAGVKACLLYILEEGGVFVPAAASGLDTDQRAEFERWRFGPGDAAALDQLLAERQPVILRANEDQELSSIFFRTETSRATMHSELLVLVPLLAHSEIYGAFLVDYNPGAYGASGISLEEFFDEQLAIIQGIAHQTAIAVENIRLLKSQKEEAYISVALLQVAQAVVSSNDLDEVLGSIVRITPILVGVKRVVIFLWDDDHKLFRLSQTYGIPRDATTCEYTRSEFPLLDAVCERDSLLAYPLTDGEETFSDVPDDWSFLIPPDPEEVETFLEGRENLLLAFPLSVKGSVLGVMLIEEPDALSVENTNGSQRSRSKRLEIITGISQQAALAIQNDLLQSETVERERMGREMQLAREIQRTFLPQQVPDLAGWDLRVRWRTAREVGGDFYDFFELPGQRLGVLIADVADKGMPAALFMTLVRTLVRATVQQFDSPAEVLERVNDIIVPDALEGMFITLFYAVVSLDTGEVEYANAGHNLPLWMQLQPCRVQSLERSGMALGVMEGNKMIPYKFSMQPGDYLVMYTDGVTEAFSAEGELFGEERLEQTLGQAVACAAVDPLEAGAQDVLDAIDQAVTNFIGESMPSDDLPLVVVKRN